MNKYILILFLIYIVNAQSYREVQIEKFKTIQLDPLTESILISIRTDLLITPSIFSVYLLNYEDYLNNYLTRSFNINNLLDHDDCKFTTICEIKKAFPKYNDYVIIIENNKNETILVQYYIENMSTTNTWTSVLGFIALTATILSAIGICIYGYANYMKKIEN